MATTSAVRNPRLAGWGHRLVVALSVILLGFVAVGCANLTNPLTSTIEGSPTAAAPVVSTHTPTPANCTKVNYPLIDVPSSTTGEPEMRIPRPPGWQDITDMEAIQDEFAETDAEGISFMQLANPALITADGFGPNAVVVMESWQSEPGVSLSQEAQEFFAWSESDLMTQLGAEFQSIVATTVCGQPAEIIEYTAPTASPEGVSATISGKVLMAVAESKDTTYGVGLIMATTEPDNPTYQRDSQAILDGFVFRPSDSR